MSAGKCRAAYMRVYKKSKPLEEGNCDNVLKRTKLHAERQREYRETHKKLSAEIMRNYRKRKAQENETPQASTSTGLTPTPIIYNYNKANKYFQKNFVGNPFGYACDICDRLWYMNDLKQVKENT
jgi:ribosomal protein S21